MRNFLRLFTLLIAVSLVGCGATLPKIKPYKMDIQQGNVVTSEMLLKLRPGMTKSQVKFIMGTPLLVDSFHTNRWDYFYQLRKQGKIVSQRRVILDFENDLLKGVRGDVVPKGSTAEDVAQQLEAESKGEEKPAVTEEEKAEPAEPVVTLIEEPAVAVESTDASTEAAPEPSTLAPEDALDADGAGPTSVLAVPIPVVPAVEAPVSAPVDALKEELVPAEMPAPEGLEPNVEMLKEAPAPEAVPMEAVTAVEAASVVEASKEVLTEMPAKADSDKRVFRLDRKLDTTRIIPVEVSASEESLPDSVVQERQDESPSVQDDPSFFERMLEKIGF
ncbi:MAG: outer membrane protein assembly factor BamE [Methylophilaceae bacterium]